MIVEVPLSSFTTLPRFARTDLPTLLPELETRHHMPLLDISTETNFQSDTEIGSVVNSAYRKYFRLWAKLARGAGLTEDEANDVVHSVIAAILSDPKRRFESLEHARNYVAKSVLNRVKVVNARSRRITPWEENVEGRFAVIPDDCPGDQQKERMALQKAVQKLPRRDFDILKMRFFSGFTLAQVGSILGMPISTVKSREDVILRRMRVQLRKSGF